MPTPTLGRLLIVDDEVELMTVLGNMLRKQGYETTGFASGNEALEALREREFDLLLADLMMPEMDGITLLKAGMEIDPHLTGIIMTGQGTVQTAVEAMKGGAFDYLLKPFKLNAVLPVLARAMDFRRLRLDNVQLRDTLAVYELSKAVAFTLDTNTILHKVADAALQQCEADEVSIMLPTGENDGLYVAVVRGEQREHLLGERLRMEQGIAGWVARHHEMLTLEGEINDPRFAPVRPRPDIRSAISMPMLVGNHLVGVLNVNATRRRRPLTLGQIKALTILVSIAAPALEAARLYEQVRQNDEQHRLVLDNVDEVVYMAGAAKDDPLDGSALFVSGRVESILGYKPEEFIRDSRLWRSILHPDDLPTVAEATRTMYANQQGAIREYRVKHKVTGEYRWMEDRVVPKLDEAGRMIGFFGVARDVTERKQAEAALKKLSNAVEQTADTVFICNREGVIEYVNLAFEALTGYTREEVVGQSPRILKSAEHPPEFYVVLWKTILAGKVFRATFANLKKNGEVYYEEKTITPLKDERGSITHFVSTGKDITERMMAEQKLREAEEKYRTLVEQLPAITFTVEYEATERTTYISPQVETILGFSQAEWLADPELWLKQIHPDDREQVQARIRKRDASGKALDIEYRALARDGRVLWFRNQSVLIGDEAGRPRYVHGVMFDITERKRAEEEIQRQLQRLAALSSIDQAIMSSFDLRLTLNILLNRVMAQLGVDAADVLLYNPSTLMLEYAVGHGLRNPAVERTSQRLGQGNAGRAALERRIISIPNLPESPTPGVRTGLLIRDDVVAYYAVPLIAKGRVKGVLEVFHRAPLDPDQEWLSFFEALAGQAAIAIENAQLFEDLQRSNTELILAYDATIEGWSRALDMRDKETEGHTQRVTEMSERLARAMGISEAEMVHNRRGALLHDIGKMGVPDSILLKPDKLTDEEWVVMRRHPQLAFEMLAPITFLRPALDIPGCHHEKWDGTGYPRGLKGEQIPLAARIFAVVDVYDALRSDRPYRPGWSEEKVREYIREQAGQHFDPQVVEMFLKTIPGSQETALG